MATSCVPANRCGTLVPGWMAGKHPSVEDGVVKHFVCFAMNQLCCMASVSMRVRNCSGFYVYKLDLLKSLGFSFRLCGAGFEGNVWLTLQLTTAYSWRIIQHFTVAVTCRMAIRCQIISIKLQVLQYVNVRYLIRGSRVFSFPCICL